MSSPQTFDAIHDYLVAQWTSTPIIFENEPYPTTDVPAPWVLVEIFGDFYDQASIGADPIVSNRWREGGQLMLHVMTPDGTGTSQARTYAKQLLDLFRGQELAGVIFRDGSIGASEPGVNDGNYFRMTASIDWLRDEG